MALDYESADSLCIAFMRMFPFPVVSFDQWILEHQEQLTESQLNCACQILRLHPDCARD